MCEGDNPRGERKALQRRFPLSPWVFSQISHSSGATRGAGALLLQCSVTHPTFLTPHLFCHNGVLAIRHTNDCVSNPIISGTLRSVRPGGLYRYLRIVRFLEVSVTVQLHRCTHEIINNLSARILFSAVLAVYLLS